jgi:hypothetical protein
MSVSSLLRRALAVALLLGVAWALAGSALATTSHTSATSVQALTVSGTPARPVFTLNGSGLSMPQPNPTTSPSNKPPLCPLVISGNAGLNYGTQFYLLAWTAGPADNNSFMYAAGRYRPSLSELDCIGLIVLSRTTKKVVFTLGHAYQQYYRTKPRLLRNRDVIEVVLKGAAIATVVHY